MTQQKSYQYLSKELDEVIAKLQSPDIDVDEALNLYEHGQKIASELEKYLKTAKNKVIKISDGNN